MITSTPRCPPCVRSPWIRSFCRVASGLTTKGGADARRLGRVYARHVPVSIALLSVCWSRRAQSLSNVDARPHQSHNRRRPRVVTSAASSATTIGSAVGGVMVVAMGTTLAGVRTTAPARYALALPPGESSCAPRAAATCRRSASRCACRRSVELERNITLVRQGATTRQVMLAGVGDLPLAPPASGVGIDLRDRQGRRPRATRPRGGCAISRVRVARRRPGAAVVTGDAAVDEREHPGYSYAAPDGSNVSSLLAARKPQGK